LKKAVKKVIVDLPEHADDPACEETLQSLRHIFGKVAELRPLFAGMSRDKLLEMWSQTTDLYCSFTLYAILNDEHDTPVPLFPRDIHTDEERFAVLPDALRKQLHQQIRQHVESQAEYVFSVADRAGFPLPEHVQRDLLEKRLQEYLLDGGFKFWQDMQAREKRSAKTT
jgi:hypothetical protein